MTTFVIPEDLPDEVRRLVEDQLREIVEYELRIWRYRQEERKPNITQTFTTVPIVQ